MNAPLPPGAGAKLPPDIVQKSVERLFMEREARRNLRVQGDDIPITVRVEGLPDRNDFAREITITIR